MTHDIPELDKKGLRDFALVTGAIIAVLFGLFFPWVFDFDIPHWPFYVFGILAVWGFVAPMSLQPVYRVWMKFGMAIGWVMNRVILSIVFFVLFMPVGFIMRLVGYDPMGRKLDSGSGTYRNECKPRASEHMDRPY